MNDDHILEQTPSDKQHARNVAEFDKILADTFSLLSKNQAQSRREALAELLHSAQKKVASAIYYNYDRAYELSGCHQDELVSRLSYKALNELSELHSDETDDGVIFLVWETFAAAYLQMMHDWAEEIVDLEPSLYNGKEQDVEALMNWYRRNVL